MEVTPEMDISKEVASGATHHPVLRGKSPKDVHWYVYLPCLWGLKRRLYKFQLKKVTSFFLEAHTISPGVK